MYCKFERISFLHSYEDSRNLAIKKAYEKLNKNIITYVEENCLNGLKDKMEYDEILESYKNVINTKINSLKKKVNKNSHNKLVFSLDSIHKKSDLKSKESINTLNFIIKSYEIKKELHLLNENLDLDKKLYKDYLESYHFMFSLVLIKATLNRINQYKCFNTLLKLNDLMIYRMHHSLLFNPIFIFYSLVLENKIYNVIKKEKIGN
tara:strand:- start:7934 stop:8551 length:618 start_codon:yes stop_codon:yes gene_type:complete